MAGARYIGVMSGTSGDGVDACLARFSGGRPRMLGAASAPYDDALRRALLAVNEATGLARLADLGVRLADVYADAVDRVLHVTGCRADEVRAIGCHGQNVLHRPDGAAPTSIQLGDPHRLADRTGIDVVSDFRRADVAAGGQGAPLAPAFHAAAFGSRRESRVVINTGGIANVTFLPAGDAPVTGFDTGPANALMDGWIARHHGARFDADGSWAAQGTVDETLLEALLADPYFERAPPKSTGREHFHQGWLDDALASLEAQPIPVDVQATLAELTAVTVARAIRQHGPDCRRAIVCGGGARNGHLLQRLAAQLPGVRVGTTAELGVEPEHVEAMAFAWLAQRRVRGLPGNRPEVTGARQPLVLGSLVRAPRPARGSHG